MRSLGEQAHQLTIDQTTRTGATISCQKDVPPVVA
jgi:hypothetical protein